jgi:heme A synthase
MNNPWLHRFAVLVALFTLALIVIGAWLSSEVLPLPGGSTLPSALPLDMWMSLSLAHRVLGDTTGTLTIALAIWLTMAGGPRRNLGWFLGTPMFLNSSPRALGIVHALLAPIFLSVVAAIVVFTSKRFASGPDLVDDKSGMLRSTSLWMMAFILLQIVLGASYRYDVLGVLWHILNAMVVLVMVLIVCVIALKQFPVHRALRPAAVHLVAVAGLQVLLGFATFLVLLMVSENNSTLVGVSVAHITIGAVTLAAATAMTIEIRHNIRA